MKVIIIKEIQKWKKNEIVEVADGYAKNFLIKNKYALPFNHSTSRKRDQILNDQKKQEDSNVEIANKTKKYIESLKPVMFLKVDENLVVHSSITRKQIIEMLRENNIKLPNSKNVENIKIDTLGISKVSVKIYKDIVATLTIEIRKNNG